MSADVINLRKARKAKARDKQEKHAAENRARFGRPKAERDAIAKLDDLDRARLDGARRNTTDEPAPKPGTRT